MLLRCPGPDTSLVQALHMPQSHHHPASSSLHCLLHPFFLQLQARFLTPGLLVTIYVHVRADLPNLRPFLDLLLNDRPLL